MKGCSCLQFSLHLWWLMGSSADLTPDGHALCPAARPCGWGCSFPVPQCWWGLCLPLCECQQGQMFGSGGRAAQGYVVPHLPPPDVPAAPRCDGSSGEAAVIWGQPVPLAVPPLPVPQNTPWPQAVRLDTGGLCSAT